MKDTINDKSGNNQVKVMLINPPQKYFNQSLGFNVYFPLGLLSVASMVRDMCSVKIFDCLITDFEIKKTEDFTLYGTPFNKVKEAIEDFNPDVVGITIPFSSQSENAKKISRICRDINPKIKVVFGGPHSSVRYRHLLEEGSCDVCVVGEGEMAFRELMKGIVSNSNIFDIEGVAYIKDNEVKYKASKFFDNLDELPFPSYDLIDFHAYLESPYLYKSRSAIPEKSISMITSRGCPFNCIFCSIKSHMGRKFRFHSPDYVLRHLRFCIEKMGIRKFHFEDDNISQDKKRFEEILDKIIESKLDIKWDTPNGIRADTLDFNILKKIKQSGCISLQLAIESGNQRILNEVIKKRSSLDYIVKIIEYCKELEIKLAAFFVIGFPGETISDIKETIALALRLYKTYTVLPILLFATPLYGTDLYKICMEEGLIDRNLTDEDLATASQFFGNPLISTKNFSKEDLKKIANEFELEMDKLVGQDSFRKILTDKKSIFSSVERINL